MSLVFDEYGRPFIILREQQEKARIKGLDAQKANILAARSVSNLLRTSLGPKGKFLPLIQRHEYALTNHQLSFPVFRYGQDVGQWRWRSHYL